MQHPALPVPFRRLLSRFAAVIAVAIAALAASPAPAGASGTAELATGAMHSCAIDGAVVYCWGYGNDGRLGQGDNLNPSRTPRPVQGLTGVTPAAITAGRAHTCVLTSIGTVYCWGDGGTGQIGNDTADDAFTAARVGGAGDEFDDVTAIAAGADHTCAIRNTPGVRDREVWCWGDDGAGGQLGGGGDALTPRPVKYAGGSTVGKATMIAAGRAHSCAVTEEASPGTTFTVCWGSNTDGQLGNGDDEGGSAVPGGPVVIAGGAAELTNVKSVSAGRAHTCAVAADDKVFCWGSNSASQVGVDPAVTPKSATAVEVPGVTATSVTAGRATTCAVLAAGADVQCWGDGGAGQLGTGTTLTGSSGALPGPVVTGLLGVSEVALGDQHACAVRAAGIACWGNARVGRLGNALSVNSAAPSAVSGLDQITSVASGRYHACALRNDATKTVECWGVGANGRLGRGDTLNGAVPAPVSGLSGVSAISAGGSHSCAVYGDDDRVNCWGSGSSGFGQLGPGIHEDRAAPSDASGDVRMGPFSSEYLAGVTAISSGANYTCATYGPDSTLACWGENEAGQLTGDPSERITAPVQHIADGSTEPTDLTAVHQVATGALHACAIYGADRKLACWGLNWTGAIGTGSTEPARITSPFTVPGMTGVVSVAAGDAHTCAVLDAGATVKCWGNGGSGRLGNGATTSSLTPVDVIGLPGLDSGGDAATVVQVAAAAAATCALRADGVVLCWGMGSRGQLGHGGFTMQTSAALVLGYDSVDRLAAGGEHVCGISDSRTGAGVECWGAGGSGQLGDGMMPAGHYPLQPAPRAVCDFGAQCGDDDDVSDFFDGIGTDGGQTGGVNDGDGGQVDGDGNDPGAPGGGGPADPGGPGIPPGPGGPGGDPGDPADPGGPGPGGPGTDVGDDSTPGENPITRDPGLGTPWTFTPPGGTGTGGGGAPGGNTGDQTGGSGDGTSVTKPRTLVRARTVLKFRSYVIRSAKPRQCPKRVTITITAAAPKLTKTQKRAGKKPVKPKSKGRLKVKKSGSRCTITGNVKFSKAMRKATESKLTVRLSGSGVRKTTKRVAALKKSPKQSGSRTAVRSSVA